METGKPLQQCKETKGEKMESEKFPEGVGQEDNLVILNCPDYQSILERGGERTQGLKQVYLGTFRKCDYRSLLLRTQIHGAKTF